MTQTCLKTPELKATETYEHTKPSSTRMYLADWLHIMDNKPEPDEVVWHETERYFRVRWGMRTGIYPITLVE